MQVRNDFVIILKYLQQGTVSCKVSEFSSNSSVAEF